MSNGRCRNHGGIVRVVLRSPEGVERATAATHAYWAAWRQAKGLPAWWRRRLVHTTSAEWLAKQAKAV